MNELFKRALNGQDNQVPPIWFMRQAGRYHKHYQDLRAKHSFIELCKNPELAAEVTWGPIRDFDFDVAILFSDLLFPLEALGLGLSYDPGPKLGRQLTMQNIQSLKPLAEAIQGVEFQREAMKAARERLPKNKSLIGFVGGPWTLFTYAVEGEHKGSLTKAKASKDLYRAFSEHIVPLLIANIELQLEGGAELVMIFDTAAGELWPQQFRKWVEPDLNRLLSLFPGQLGYYAKGVSPEHLVGMKDDARWAGFGYDHRWDLATLLKNRPFGFIQGNFDQALLHSSPSDLNTWFELYLKPLKQLPLEQRRGWVCGLGHGVLPGTPESSVKKLIDLVRKEFA
ncbi:MAG: uroporphyrinogen decarboxylase family protein [Bdellovibrionales bacterium]